MIISLDMLINIPIYVQLRNQIVTGIGKGELKIGENLPTVRQLAKPAAKIISVDTAAIVTAILVGVFSIIIWFDNAEIVVKMDENQVTLNAAIYNTDFKVSDIQSVKILQKMPEDDFTRTNGELQRNT